jgi:hypothetical protein
VRKRFVLEGVVAVTLTLGLLWLLEGRIGMGGPRPVAHHECTGQRAVIASVGDMLLGDRAQKRLDKNGYTFPFSRVTPLLEADLLMGNLEAPITLHDERFMPSKKWSYKQEPPVAPALRETGFDVLTLANNHTLDFGPVGMADTIRLLDAEGIRVIGGGPDEDAAREGLIVELNGTRVGLLSYMEPYGKYRQENWFAEGDRPGAALLDAAVVKEDIARMRQQADVVIVHCHFGRNYRNETKYQKRMARTVIDLGADAVNGHHPHVAQGVEIYKGKPILYSLGNFTFGTGGRFPKDEQGYGLVARYILCDGVIESIELDLIGTNNRIVRYRPVIIGEQEAVRVMDELMESFDTPLRWEGSTAIIDLVGRRGFLGG